MKYYLTQVVIGSGHYFLLSVAQLSALLYILVQDRESHLITASGRMS